MDSTLQRPAFLHSSAVAGTCSRRRGQGFDWAVLAVAALDWAALAVTALALVAAGAAVWFGRG